ncbi:nucleotide sugar dehydrogenase [Candidatus Lokiarchaeum ossiferum]|uniref:nucleotide sugar dehydrogenase n=1 Tax=Candidatus Lokiarchaeum ossiferum TaxID=2951803 RepID=UPI00352C8DF8
MDIQVIEELIESKKLSVAVFGLGRIGLPTALMYAKGGYHVNGVDINLPLLEDLKNKKTFIDEPGLPEILEYAVDNGMITFSNDFEAAIANSDIIVICVPTPVSESKVPNYTAIIDVAKKIGKYITKNKIVINESSVSPTTIKSLLIPLIENESGLQINLDFGVCSCPERADPGKIVDNWNKVARIVGGSSDEIGKSIVKLYEKISQAQIYQVSTPGTANAVKLTENIFRDVNIALMNEFAVLYERLGIDVKEVIGGSSTKYNFQPHYPGPGVGGPCLPANSYYIIQDAEKVDYIPFLIRVSREVNDRMPQNVLDLVTNALNSVGKCLSDSVVSVLGISYKANVRDVQISPAMKVIDYLLMKNAKIQVWDPYYKGEHVGNFQVLNSIEESLLKSDCVVVLTDHKEFYSLDFENLHSQTGQPFVIIDSRNIYDPQKLPQGTIYCGVGRKLKKVE